MGNNNACRTMGIGTIRLKMFSETVKVLTDVFYGTHIGNLYFLDGSTVTGKVAVSNSSDESDTSKLWHMRLGHTGEKALQTLTKVKFGTAIHRTDGILDYVHSNIWGPSKNASL
ncbi:uncharacterized mitochondrial protein AtMg00300-like [Actinidia eriantha]|uniref:uncharacterized mitochondrial protein AtMg00300-like n=1 Tax=Actinidia eriantha TaxID=165200 RepID=UPI002588B424|nr:uncharacterized mitochondrial protein AtMg00300-like [Actinidia eriantha]